MAVSSVAWGDYDNDGDLDILLTGYLGAGAGDAARVYRNDAGIFTDIGAGLTGIDNSSATWWDFDNDGDLDILSAGVRAGSVKLYRNDGGGAFTGIELTLVGAQFGSLACGDFDNDGDLDFLFTGSDGSTPLIAKVIRNDGGGVFTDIGAALPGVWFGSAAWGDYDNDGDLDILFTGNTDPTTGQGTASSVISRVYRNDGGGAFTDIAAALPGVRHSSVAWGDYDNDGDLDILLTGASPIEHSAIARVYRNDGGGVFTDIAAGLAGFSLSSAAWGDYDNDGDLDILVCGDSGTTSAKVYRNDGGGVFTDIAAALTGVDQGSVAWGDYDNDGDLDFLLTGQAQPGNVLTSIVYRNDVVPVNAPPAAPGGLASSVSGDQATLTWTAASDDHTPASGLSYNLRVGTTPGGNEISAAMADGASGYRRVVGLGNAQQRVSWKLTVPPGIHYWSVQAVDGAWAGSPFATEQSFTIQTPTRVDFAFAPSTLNLRSNGRWVSGTIAPEPPASPSDIDVASILLNGSVPVDRSGPISIGDADHDGRPDLTVKFKRAAVAQTVSEGDAVAVTITGEIGSGRFEGSDVIRVIGGHASARIEDGVFHEGSPSEPEDTPVVVPLQLALDGAVPNPGRGLDVSFSLGSSEPATLAVFDVRGRVVSRREVGSLGAGRHVVALGASGSLPPGVYVVHLIQGDHQLIARAIVTR